MVFAHPGVALNDDARPGHVGLITKGAGFSAPAIVVHFKDSDVGHSLRLPECHPGHVERAHQVYPSAHVSSFEDTIARARAQITGGGAGQPRPARLAEPGLR